MPPINPYIAGRPLREKDKFFGRQDVLEWIAREVRTPGTNSIVLFGQRRIGKTSILLQIEQRLKAEKDFVPVYYDLQNASPRVSLKEITLEIAGEISDAIAGIPISREQFDEQGRYFLKEYLPQCYEQLGDGKRLVFLFDEFDVIDSFSGIGDASTTQAVRNLTQFFYRGVTADPRPVFIFVVGRRAEDLSSLHSTFKSALRRNIWVLSQEDTEALVRQAESNKTLRFTDSAVDNILSLTGNHPYLTQLLCQRIWEYVHTKKSTNSVEPEDVDASVSDVLQTGQEAFAWIWDGLSPLEKIYASALAEVSENSAAISESRVMEILRDHVQRLDIREVTLAPEELMKRNVLCKTSNQEYKFSIELIRRWVKENRPLHKVKDELDSIEPLAENYYKTGKTHLVRGEIEKAKQFFEEALKENPCHFHAHLSLGGVWLDQNKPDKAVKVLYKAYQLDKKAATSLLVEALLKLGETDEKAGREDRALNAYKKILKIAPNEKTAGKKCALLLEKKGDEELKKGNLQAALKYYQPFLSLEEKALKLKVAATRFLEKENVKKAKLLYEKALDLVPNDQEVIKALDRKRLHRISQVAAYNRLQKMVFFLVFLIIGSTLYHWERYQTVALHLSQSEQRVQSELRKEAELKAKLEASKNTNQHLDEVKEQLREIQVKLKETDALLRQAEDAKKERQDLLEAKNRLLEETRNIVRKKDEVIRQMNDAADNTGKELVRQTKLREELQAGLTEKDALIRQIEHVKSEMQDQLDAKKRLLAEIQSSLRDKDELVQKIEDARDKALNQLAAQTTLLGEAHANLAKVENINKPGETESELQKQLVEQRRLLEETQTRLKKQERLLAKTKADLRKKNALIAKSLCNCPNIEYKKCTLEIALGPWEQTCATICVPDCPQKTKPGRSPR